MLGLALGTMYIIALFAKELALNRFLDTTQVLGLTRSGPPRVCSRNPWPHRVCSAYLAMPCALCLHAWFVPASALARVASALALVGVSPVLRALCWLGLLRYHPLDARYESAISARSSVALGIL